MTDTAYAPWTRGSAADPATAAFETVNWLRKVAVPTEAGRYWPADPADPAARPPFVAHSPHGLYGGTAGIVLFLLRLADAVPDKSIMDDAIAGADEIAASWRMESAARSTGEGTDLRFSMYEGLPGEMFALLEMWRVTGEERYAHAAREAAVFLTQHAGPGWTGQAGVARGDSGVLLSLLHAAEVLDDPAPVETAVVAGKRLVEIAEPVGEGGLRWPAAPEMYLPNFEFGTAGVGFALARLHAVTGDPEFGEAAVAAARHLADIAVGTGQGALLFHHEPGGTDLFYLGHCHGPAGTAKLFHQLHLTTGADEWLDWVRRFADGVLGADPLTRQSPGYWNVVSQCCGTAGIGEFLLRAWALTGESEYLQYARELGGQLIARSTPAEDGGRCWYDAANRHEPWAVAAYTGYMCGAAGVAGFLTSLHLADAGRFVPPPSPTLPRA
ncbi:lantibiotic modifying-like protein [Amycolatopsis sp. WAC 04197]|uniref:lanthionine synthetase LanC family protein n=1 Tax=Amycolatopsis sp. WAC 04197 TaxID=2203199 RepID=UPI000F76758E|nr:lanthionine synthetase LanC family protein [Amycolatopsis sp. WAC 04197]RSN39544.1 lantibiotic modifying-like protein [Amycolatopsis sp. WAC 04197]